MNTDFQNYHGNIKNSSLSYLANRPLSPIKTTSINYTKTNPVASEDINKTGIIPVESKYDSENNKILPVTISPINNNQYVVLENDLLNNNTMNINVSDKLITDLPIPKLNVEKKQEKKVKMDYTTQFYVGSLTVIGLFVFYRLLQKTK